MKSNISIELNDEERAHLDNIYHNKKSAKLITRKDLNNLVQLIIKELLDSDVGNFTEVTKNVAEEGYKYYFNSQRVTAEEWEAGFEVWLEKRKKERES